MALSTALGVVFCFCRSYVCFSLSAFDCLWLVVTYLCTKYIYCVHLSSRIHYIYFGFCFLPLLDVAMARAFLFCGDFFASTSILMGLKKRTCSVVLLMVREGMIGSR